MALYRQLMIANDDGTEWRLLNPEGPLEALRLAWLLWRYPDRVAILAGATKEYWLAHTTHEEEENEVYRGDTSASIDKLRN